MQENYSECYKAVRVFEGGNDDDPQDPGGRTSRGIIQREWTAYINEPANQTRHLPTDVWQAPEPDIAIIYKRDYWDAQHLSEAPSGPDETDFDYGVNSGIGRSQKVIRRCLHMADNAPYKELKARLDSLDKAQVKVLINAINDERMAFLKTLKTFKRFGVGWTKRVSTCRAISLHLVDAPVAPLGAAPAPPPDNTGTAKGVHPEPTAAKRVTVGGGTGTATAVGATWHDWFVTHPVVTVFLIALVATAIVAVVVYITNRHKQKQEAPPPGWVPPPELKPAAG